MVSNRQLLAWTPLIEAMKMSILEEFGVRVKILSSERNAKAAFYSIRKEFSPEFDGLSFLSTSTPQEYLIYHPSIKGEPNAKREERLG